MAIRRDPKPHDREGEAIRGTRSVSPHVTTRTPKRAKSAPKIKRRAKVGGRRLAPATIYFFAVISIAAISLWIRTGFPVGVITAGYDDLLFIRLATFLKSGNWLGPYDQLTLAKGMFYSMFIVFSHFLSIPLKIAEQIAYLAACGLTVELVRRRARSNYFALVFFALLALNPAVWNKQLDRVIREGLYLSLSLALVILFLMVVFPASDKGRFTPLRRAALGITLGLIGAAYWLTREEGIWLVPALGVVGLIGIAKILWPHAATSSEQDPWPRSAQLRAVAVPLVLAILAFVAGDFLVAGLNYRYYGIFETNEFRSKSFLRAYGAVTRIRTDHWEPFVLFPGDARERAYAVSPAARELKPFLDGVLAKSWRVYCAPCSEVQAGWFLWELRDAVHDAGHSRTAREAMTFYDTLADQIDAACANGGIPCLAERDTLSPPFRAEYLGQSIKIARGLTKIMFALRDEPIGILPSRGEPESIALFADMVGPVTPAESTLVGNRVIKGWAAAISAAPTVKLIAPGRGEYPSSTTLLPAQDLASEYPNYKPIRFQIETSCPPSKCDIVMSAPGLEPGGIPLSKLAPGRGFGSASMMLGIEDVALSDVQEFENQSTQLQTASAISSGYAIGFPILSLLGVLGILLAAVVKRPGAVPIELWALCVASITAIITRIALLSYITATSFPAAHMLYASPASPFVIIFAAAGIYCGWSALSARLRRPETEPVQLQQSSSRVRQAAVSTGD